VPGDHQHKNRARSKKLRVLAPSGNYSSVNRKIYLPWRAAESRHAPYESHMNSSIDAKSVAMCDTEPIAIEGMRALLNQCEDLRLAAAETSLLGGMEIVRQHALAILILDKSFGIHSIMDFLKRLHGTGSLVAPVVWGVNLSEAEALRLMQAGALGVVRKTAPTAVLLDCMRVVATGNTWMEESVLQEPERTPRGTRSNLTLRELQVVELVEQGLKNRDIGTQLGIRPGTVKIHLKHIFEKTGIRGRYGLALSGLREKGLLSMPAA
jgi:DNA-binding NarL/FixJ family response regulator